MMELADEDLFKTVITNAFKVVKENMNITKREMEYICKTQIKLLQMKNRVSKTKDILDRWH